MEKGFLRYITKGWLKEDPNYNSFPSFYYCADYCDTNSHRIKVYDPFYSMEAKFTNPVQFNFDIRNYLVIPINYEIALEISEEDGIVRLRFVLLIQKFSLFAKPQEIIFDHEGVFSKITDISNDFEVNLLCQDIITSYVRRMASTLKAETGESYCSLTSPVMIKVDNSPGRICSLLNLPENVKFRSDAKCKKMKRREVIDLREVEEKKDDRPREIKLSELSSLPKLNFKLKCENLPQPNLTDSAESSKDLHHCENKVKSLSLNHSSRDHQTKVLSQQVESKRMNGIIQQQKGSKNEDHFSQGYELEDKFLDEISWDQPPERSDEMFDDVNKIVSMPSSLFVKERKSVLESVSNEERPKKEFKMNQLMEKEKLNEQPLKIDNFPREGSKRKKIPLKAYSIQKTLQILKNK